jgi:hypothetical protein
VSAYFAFGARHLDAEFTSSRQPRQLKGSRNIAIENQRFTISSGLALQRLLDSYPPQQIQSQSAWTKPLASYRRNPESSLQMS